MDETIASILLEFDLDLFRPIVPRRLSLGGILPPRAGNLVKVITGMRGSGKTYRLFQEMDALVASGVPKERICYFDFEDDRLSPVTPETGDRVLETFRYLYPDEENSQGIYLFFDELQEMKGWGAWLRRVLNANVVGFGGKILRRVPHGRHHARVPRGRVRADPRARRPRGQDRRREQGRPLGASRPALLR